MKRTLTPQQQKTLQIWKLANKIQDKVAKRKPIDPLSEVLRLLPRGTLTRMRKLLSRQTSLLGWVDTSAVRARIAAQLDKQRKLLVRVGDAAEQAAHLAGFRWEPPRLRDIVDDLQALDAEFENTLEITLKGDQSSLSVTTSPIILTYHGEEYHFNKFRLVVSLGIIGTLQAGYVQAIPLDPNYAETDEYDEISHPHVSHEQICIGDGIAAANNALAEGRLLDLLTILNSVLHTYNPRGPYVRLEDWEGDGRISCAECGESTSDPCWCDHCQHEVCDECSFRCAICGERMCTACDKRCQKCEEPICEGCTKIVGGVSLCKPCASSATANVSPSEKESV